jgi:ATP-binding cassette, subfamily B, multidrug efflux pump
MKKNKQYSALSGLGFIWQNMKQYWLAFLFVLIFVGVTTYLQTQSPLWMADGIDDLAQYVIATLKHTGVDQAHTNFVNSVLKMVVGGLAMALSMFMYTFLMSGVAAKTGGKFRTQLFDKLQKLSVRFFDESNDGDILSRFTNDIDNIANLLNQSFIQIISSLALVVSIAYEMYNKNVTLASIIFAIFGITLICILFVMNRASKYIGVQQAKLGALNGYIDEKIAGQKLVITTGTRKQTFKDFIPFNEDYRVISTKGQAYSNLLFPMVNGFSMISVALVIYFGADLVIDKILSIGLLVAFITYAQRFFQPVVQIVQQYNNAKLGLTGAGRVMSIMDEEEDVKEAKDAVELGDLEKGIKIDKINFGYDKKNLVLKDVSIEVDKNQKVALVGPTGSGKTTIMNLLNRFYDVKSGAIYYDDVNIKDAKLDSLRHRVGIVLQDSILFSGSIKDNIAYGKEDASMEEITKAAKLANIHDYIMKLDKQYDTIVDNNSSMFSVGQKQLISIARTIVVNPDLLILDEATSNVDTVTESHIQEAMNNVLKERTSFVIAHRLKTILDSDKIIVLKDGKVIEQGTHEELLKAKGFYSELYYNQFVIE